jgi:hypothetical protein
MRQRGQSLVEYLLALSAFLLTASLSARLFSALLHRAWTALSFYFALPSP